MKAIASAQAAMGVFLQKFLCINVLTLMGTTGAAQEQVAPQRVLGSIPPTLAEQQLQVLEGVDSEDEPPPLPSDRAVMEGLVEQLSTPEAALLNHQAIQESRAVLLQGQLDSASAMESDEEHLEHGENADSIAADRMAVALAQKENALSGQLPTAIPRGSEPPEPAPATEGAAGPQAAPQVSQEAAMETTQVELETMQVEPALPVGAETVQQAPRCQVCNQLNFGWLEVDCGFHACYSGLQHGTRDGCSACPLQEGDG